MQNIYGTAYAALSQANAKRQRMALTGLHNSLYQMQHFIPCSTTPRFIYSLNTGVPFSIPVDKGVLIAL